MRHKAIWILCALALGAFALGAAGCGGGGTTTVTVAADTTSTDTTSTDTTETDTTSTETTEETTTDETDTTSTDTTETETTATDTETVTTTSPDLSFINNENCRQFVQFASDFSQALSGTGDTDIQAAADELQKFADEAPDEIKDDFETLAEYYSKIADALDGVDLSSGKTPSADVIAKLAQLSQDIDTTKVTEASTNITNWTQENCTNK
jgi:hypothetical protein